MHRKVVDTDGRLVLLESDPATAADDAEATAAGLVCVREILQLRRPLPAEPTTVRVRGFRRDDPSDIASFLDINNRAFEWHPDQSNWTIRHLEGPMSESWFDPDGFLLHESDGVVDAFCWTKIHPATDLDPALGEIFVIAVDPDHHGRGLGRAMTLAGLDWLHSRGITVGMLHVEADNDPARTLYARLGFVPHSSHRWWAPPGTPPPVASSS